MQVSVELLSEMWWDLRAFTQGFNRGGFDSFEATEMAQQCLCAGWSQALNAVELTGDRALLSPLPKPIELLGEWRDYTLWGWGYGGKVGWK